MTKWDKWYNSLPAHTKASLQNQALWSDQDAFKFLLLGFVVGLLIGYIL